jgi:hypothetical protein
MEVSFTGFKNTSYSNIIKQTQSLANNAKCRNRNNAVLIQTINTQLLDDFNGNDLSLYKKALASSDIAGEFHPLSSDMVNIQTVKVNSPQGQTVYLVLNNNVVRIKDKNLKLISFIAKLLKRISNENPSNFVVNRDFIEGEDAAFATICGKDMRNVFSKERYKTFLDYAYRPQDVKAIAKDLFSDIQSGMEEYFK